MDARARRKEGVLEIPGLFLEPGFRRDTRFDEALAIALTNFAADNGCSELCGESLQAIDRSGKTN